MSARFRRITKPQQEKPLRFLYLNLHKTAHPSGSTLPSRFVYSEPGDISGFSGYLWSRWPKEHISARLGSKLTVHARTHTWNLRFSSAALGKGRPRGACGVSVCRPGGQGCLCLFTHHRGLRSSCVTHTCFSKTAEVVCSTCSSSARCSRPLMSAPFVLHAQRKEGKVWPGGSMSST